MTFSGDREKVSDADVAEAAHFVKYSFAAYGYLLYLFSKPIYSCAFRSSLCNTRQNAKRSFAACGYSPGPPSCAPAVSYCIISSSTSTTDWGCRCCVWLRKTVRREHAVLCLW